MQPRDVICKTCHVTFNVTNTMSRQTFCSVQCRPPRKVDIPERVCETCSMAFKPVYSCQRYCGKDCKWMGFSKHRRVTKEATCSHCGKDYVPKKPGKFCTQECYFASRKKFVTKTCETCDKEFTVAYRFREQKTCNTTCASVAISKTLTTRETKQCLACGKNFEVVQSYKDIGKYCSLTCFYKHKYGRDSAIVIKTCEGCGKDFQKPFTQRKIRFCTISCAVSGDRNGQYGLGKEQGRNKVPRWHAGKTKKTDDRLRLMGEKISVIMADKIVSGTWDHGFGFVGEHYVGVKNGNEQMYCRSSYESAYVRQLDSDPGIISWESEPFRIPYSFKGSIHNYVPDFLVTRAEGDSLVEVKPEILTDT